MRIIRYLFGALALVVVGLFSWQYWLFQGGIFRTSSFNVVDWKALNKKTIDDSCYRGGMAHDIETNLLSTGMSIAKVHSLLGQPDIQEEGLHGYLLGMCSGLRIDFDTLDIRFNSEGKLISTQITQH